MKGCTLYWLQSEYKITSSWMFECFYLEKVRILCLQVFTLPHEIKNPNKLPEIMGLSMTFRHLVSSPDYIPHVIALWDGYKMAIKWCETMGTFHSTKNSKNLITGSNGTHISWKCFQTEKTIQPKNLEILGAKSNGMEITSKKVLESLEYPTYPFPEIMENAVAFIITNFWEFKPEFFTE